MEGREKDRLCMCGYSLGQVGSLTFATACVRRFWANNQDLPESRELSNTVSKRTGGAAASRR